MPSVTVSESRVIGATAEKIYAVLTEPEHHKHILPPEFIRYEAEDKSTISFSIQMGPVKRDFRVNVEEVIQNVLLRETDISTGIVTEFELEPQASQTKVTIRTSFTTPDTIMGQMEYKFAPMFLKKLYLDELEKLSEYLTTVVL